MINTNAASTSRPAMTGQLNANALSSNATAASTQVADVAQPGTGALTDAFAPTGKGPASTMSLPGMPNSNAATNPADSFDVGADTTSSKSGGQNAGRSRT